MILILALCACCKKDKEQAYPEDKFVSLLTQKWYVGCYVNYEDAIITPSIIYEYDGDSTVLQNYFNQYCIGNPELCSLEYIENIQFWNIINQGGTLNLSVEDICGRTKDYIFKYSNYSSKAGEDHTYFQYRITANISLTSDYLEIHPYEFELVISRYDTQPPLYFGFKTIEEFGLKHWLVFYPKKN
ncbi:MAG: hypothetical protein RQ761_11655 [Bacteroidales bacterium]|nr:hypothetical protein [Bacteroidales bacterium]